MTQIQDSHVSTTAGTVPMAFTFQGTPSGQFQLRFVDLSYDGLHHRLSFVKDRALETILQQELVLTLRGVVARVQGTPGTLVLPEVSVALGDAVISHCTVIVSTLKSGLQQIVVRFRDAVGRVLSAFRETVFSHPRNETIIEGLKNTILYSLYLPLVNIKVRAEELDQTFMADDAVLSRQKLGRLRREVVRLASKCEKVILPKLKNERDP